MSKTLRDNVSNNRTQALAAYDAMVDRVARIYRPGMLNDASLLRYDRSITKAIDTRNWDWVLVAVGLFEERVVQLVAA